MKITTAILIILFLLFSGFQVLGASKDKVLLYYFRNISGESTYDNLMEKIPLCLYYTMKDKIEDNNLFIINTEDYSIDQVRESEELWNRRVIMKIAEKKNFQKVIYGYFYVEEEKPKIMGKLLYSDTGLVVDLDYGDRKYKQFIEKVESLNINEIEECVKEKKMKTYSPPLDKIAESGKGTFSPALYLSGGAILPFGEWKNLYLYGIFSEINLLIFPKYDLFPLGLGVNCSYSFFRKDDNVQIPSELSTLSLGASISYFIKIGKFFHGLAPGFDTGISTSMLKIDENSYNSIDPYTRVGLTLVVKPARKMHLGLKGGVYSVFFKESTLYSYFLELGLWIY